MRTCERCRGLAVTLNLHDGSMVCKACAIQSEREKVAAKARHPAGKGRIRKKSA